MAESMTISWTVGRQQMAMIDVIDDDHGHCWLIGACGFVSMVLELWSLVDGL
jgi:hypothetical protein